MARRRDVCQVPPIDPDVRPPRSTMTSLTVLDRHARAVGLCGITEFACSRLTIHGVCNDADPDARRSSSGPLGLGDVIDTVSSLCGPAGRQLARVEVEPSSDDDDLLLEAVLFPIDLLEQADAAWGRRGDEEIVAAARGRARRS